MSFLLDTNVISELRKPKADRGVKQWFESVQEEDLFLSVLVLGEIRRGVELLRRRDPGQAALFDPWLASVKAGYAERILPVTEEVAEEWGRMSVPDPLPVTDGLMAATARVNGLTLVTRNTKGLERTGAAVFNPWAGEE
ncbi:MAG: type II toxin-antitoxin system VapC family toxin [Myxococcales bacterium]|nr:type II toxin-antitoxin system VapC family toxin [Myxococcales bacterium]